MTTDKKFACVINCMDGRVQDAVKKYMQENYGVDYVDMVTEPGPNKILADDLEKSLEDDIKKCVGVSVHHHGSKIVAIAGHAKCAGNPATKEEQIEHLRKAKKTAEGFGYPVEIILLWVADDWKTVELIK
jgi:hypothetical protein